MTEYFLVLLDSPSLLIAAVALSVGLSFCAYIAACNGYDAVAKWLKK